MSNTELLQSIKVKINELIQENVGINKARNINGRYMDIEIASTNGMIGGLMSALNVIDKELFELKREEVT